MARLIHLAIAFDRNYQQQFFALLDSILTTNKPQSLVFHLISPDIENDTRRKIIAYLSSVGSGCHFYNIDESDVNDLKTEGTWTHAVYYRLLFPLLVSRDVNRLLYLDSDMLVVSELSELYDIQLDNFPVGAVYDNYVREQPDIGIPEGEYFNSGMLIINLQEWRTQEISPKTISYLQNHPERIRYVDQCGLNFVLKGNWKRLDCKYNLLYSYLPTEISGNELMTFLSDKIIIHFTLQRPWEFLCKNRLRDLYWEHVRRSPLARHAGSRYADFELKKIPHWIRLRILEKYFDSSSAQTIWRSLKNLVK